MNDLVFVDTNVFIYALDDADRTKQQAAREEARAEVRDLLAWGPAMIDDRVLNQSWKIQDRYQFSFWDALIVAAAQSLSCKYLLTEDLQANQQLDGLVVINPFVRDPASIFSS